MSLIVISPPFILALKAFAMMMHTIKYAFAVLAASAAIVQAQQLGSVQSYICITTIHCADHDSPSSPSCTSTLFSLTTSTFYYPGTTTTTTESGGAF